jgi:CPA2 family monovalent cation:H+ antiporter-2
VLGLAAAVIGIKAALIFGLARAWGLSGRAAIETALVLGPAGEFAFVIVNTSLVAGVATPVFTQAVLVAATVSMFAVPVVAMLGQRIAQSVSAPPVPTIVPGAEPEPRDASVLIVGFGRVGRLVAEMLTEHGQSFIAVDTDAAAVAAGRREGFDVSYGDAARSEMLALCGVETIRALVVTMDAPSKVDEVVHTARSLREDLIIIARARDDRHAARLYGLGVTDAVPETTEASLQLAENTLVDLGVPMGLVLASIHERRDKYRAIFQAAIPEERRNRKTRALRSSLKA